MGAKLKIHPKLISEKNLPDVYVIPSKGNPNLTW